MQIYVQFCGIKKNQNNTSNDSHKLILHAKASLVGRPDGFLLTLAHSIGDLPRGVAHTHGTLTLGAKRGPVNGTLEASLARATSTREIPGRRKALRSLTLLE